MVSLLFYLFCEYLIFFFVKVAAESHTYDAAAKVVRAVPTKHATAASIKQGGQVMFFFGLASFTFHSSAFCFRVFLLQWYKYALAFSFLYLSSFCVFLRKDLEAEKAAKLQRLIEERW